MNGNSKLPRIVVGLLFVIIGFYVSWQSRKAADAPQDESAPVVNSETSEEPVKDSAETTKQVRSDSSEDNTPIFGPKAKSAPDAAPTASKPKPSAEPKERPLTVPKSLGSKKSAPSSPTSGTPPPPKAGQKATTAGKILVPNVKVRDLDGNVAFEGTVDLTETVERIRNGKTLSRFRNDGITFENRERRLPAKPKGYYHEYVHPTPDLSGPGPQRVVAGEDGQMWYTHDHYRTFKKIVP